MRLRQRQAEVPDYGGDWGPPPAYLAGDASAQRDGQLGKIFCDMRHAMGVSRETIARRLATTPATIDSFEHGAVANLPHWKETGRIVRTYCELMRVDPGPILQYLSTRLGDLEVRPTRPVGPGGTTRSTPRSGPTTRSRRTEPTRSDGSLTPRRRRRRKRVLFAFSAPLAFVAGVVYLAQLAPQPVYRAIDLLPDRAEIAVRAGLDYIMLLSAPRRDGLRWIEVSDPRVRKADKLEPAQR